MELLPIAFLRATALRAAVRDEALHMCVDLALHETLVAVAKLRPGSDGAFEGADAVTKLFEWHGRRTLSARDAAARALALAAELAAIGCKIGQIGLQVIVYDDGRG